MEHIVPVAAETAHDGLDFGVAETDVELKHFGTVFVNHDTHENNTPEIEFFLLDTLEEGLKNFIFNLLPHGIGDNGSRRVSSHAAGVGPLVVVKDPLVVLGGNQRNNGVAVAESED